MYLKTGAYYFATKKNYKTIRYYPKDWKRGTRTSTCGRPISTNSPEDRDIYARSLNIKFQ